ncbi:MAG: twin-arginine translocation pathway signal protein [Pseudomonadota bacterium]
MQRRKVISLIGGGVVLAASASVLGTREGEPLEANSSRDIAGNYDEARMAALSWAILAPSPLNLQPWVAQLLDDDKLLIWRDKDLWLPESDPDGRVMTISMGCFLEVFRLAAAEQGLNAQTQLVPGGEEGPLAQITLRSGAQPDPLFQQVSTRHTNRQSYETRLPDDTALETLHNEASSIITDSEIVEALRELTLNGMLTEVSTPRIRQERLNLLQMGERDANTVVDGETALAKMIGMQPGLSLFANERQDTQTLQEARMSLATAMRATPAYATVKTGGNSRIDQIEAGRRWLRFWLTATAQGIAVQPVCQVLQSYPEQAAHRATLYELVADPQETVQMLGRIGYAPPGKPSPRWPIETRVLAS